MLLILFLVYLCSNLSLIRAEDTSIDNVTISLTYAKNCKTLLPSYTFTEDQTVTLLAHWTDQPMSIKSSWWQLVESDKMYDQFKDPYKHIITANKSMEGTWMFKFLYLKDKSDLYNNTEISHTTFQGHNYSMSICTTKVKIAPARTPDTEKLIQNVESQNSNIEQLMKAITAIKEENMEIKKSITEQSQKILNRIADLERNLQTSNEGLQFLLKKVEKW